MIDAEVAPVIEEEVAQKNFEFLADNPEGDELKDMLMDIMF